MGGDLEWVELTPPHSPESTNSLEILQEVGLSRLSPQQREEEEKEEELIALTSCYFNKSHDLQLHDTTCNDANSKPSNDDKSHDISHDHKNISHDHHMFHLLLEIKEGSSLIIHSDHDELPNVYVVCKMFCMNVPLTTGVYWRSRMPQFNVKQV